MTCQGKFLGRRALVTGAARGIGLAIARRLLEEGASVALVDLDAPALAIARRSLPWGDDRALAVCCDVGVPTDVHRLFQQVQGAFGALDILINNAAILDWTPLADLGSTRLAEVLRVNFGGAVNCCQAFAAQPALGASSRIVNVSSINGLRGTANSVAYNASKAALLSLTQSLAVELAPRGIAVNAIAPGFIDTRMSKLADGSSEYDTDWFREVFIKHRRIPCARPGTPEDVAGPVVFLASDDAKYINGQVLVVDGGVTATF
jgi:NAD(P)-dependent dehydrogenase (short-subunit alcohol dehydrogenase family)